MIPISFVRDLMFARIAWLVPALKNSVHATVSETMKAALTTASQGGK